MIRAKNNLLVKAGVWVGVEKEEVGVDAWPGVGMRLGVASPWWCGHDDGDDDADDDDHGDDNEHEDGDDDVDDKICISAWEPTEHCWESDRH